MMIRLVILLVYILSISIYGDEISEDKDQQLIESVRRCYRLRAIKRKTDRDIRPSFKHVKGESYVKLEGAIDDIDISQIDVLSECIKKYDPSRFEERKFDQNINEYGGGNDVIFLTGFMSLIMPEFVQHLTALAAVSGEEAGWRPHASHLGFRCIEKLTYHPGGELLYHIDGGSVYTLVLMLAGETEYAGGAFQIVNENRVESSHKAPKGGGIFFDSNRDHGVAPLGAGERHVLAVEFWPFEDTSFPGKRPSEENSANVEKIPALIEVLPYQQEESDLEGKESEEEEELIDPITVRGEKLSSAAYRKLLKQRNKERRERIKARARDHREKVESSKKERDSHYSERQKEADRKHKQEQSQNRKQQSSTKRRRKIGPFGIDIDLSRGFAFGLILGAIFPLILVNAFIIKDTPDYTPRKFSSYKPDKR